MVTKWCSLQSEQRDHQPAGTDKLKGVSPKLLIVTLLGTSKRTSEWTLRHWDLSLKLIKPQCAYEVETHRLASTENSFLNFMHIYCTSNGTGWTKAICLTCWYYVIGRVGFEAVWFSWLGLCASLCDAPSSELANTAATKCCCTRNTSKLQDLQQLCYWQDNYQLQKYKCAAHAKHIT